MIKIAKRSYLGFTFTCPLWNSLLRSASVARLCEGAWTQFDGGMEGCMFPLNGSSIPSPDMAEALWVFKQNTSWFDDLMGKHHSLSCTLIKGFCVVHDKTVRFIDSQWFNLQIWLIEKQTRSWMLRKVQLLDSTRISNYRIRVSWVDQPSFLLGRLIPTVLTLWKDWPVTTCYKNLRRRRCRNFRHLWFSKSDPEVPGTIAFVKNITTFQTGQNKHTKSVGDEDVDDLWVLRRCMVDDLWLTQPDFSKKWQKEEEDFSC